MATFVRVRLENGSEASVSAEFAERKGLKPITPEDGKPNAARFGKALPAKHNPLKKSAPPTDTPKEKR